MNKIPVCAITDEKLPFALETMFVSLLENANEDTFYELHAIVTGSVTQEDRGKILAIQDDYQNCSISIIDMGDRFLDSVNRHKHVSNACLYKLIFNELFPQYNKIIYLDTDLIVREDLVDLYNEEISDFYLAGVVSLFHNFKYQERFSIILNEPVNRNYVNAGVLLFNLEKIREDNKEEDFRKLIGKFNGSVDQHILNKICYGKIYQLPLKYNVSNTDCCVAECCTSLYRSTEIKKFFENEDLESTYKNPAIYHWTGQEKPWIYDNLPFVDEWFQYYNKTAYKNITLDRSKFVVKKRGIFLKIKTKIFNFFHYDIQIFSKKLLTLFKKHR